LWQTLLEQLFLLHRLTAHRIKYFGRESVITGIVVHGLGEDASMWKKWEELLTKDGFQCYKISFQDSDDKCGIARAHAVE
jgi:hypothetical protein